MFCRGLLEEAARWRALAGTATAAQAIGYKELEPYFRGECTLEEAAARLKQETRRYAKRQLSWFRRMAVQWNARAPGSCTELFLEDDLDGWTAENAEGLAYMDIDKERQ
jgi:tRNA A37 N6-isopentenylltransferase MiaA